MANRIILATLLVFIIISFILSMRKNNETASAVNLIDKNESIIVAVEENNIALKEIYLHNVYLNKLVVAGTFLGLNNTNVYINDAVKPNQTVAFFISDSACLDCHREYISLLFKYFYKEAVIIRLGRLFDNQEYLQYRIFGLIGFNELEKVIFPNKPLVAFIDNNYNLQYIFIPPYNDLDFFEKYLIQLKEILNNEYQMK